MRESSEARGLSFSAGMSADRLSGCHWAPGHIGHRQRLADELGAAGQRDFDPGGDETLVLELKSRLSRLTLKTDSCLRPGSTYKAKAMSIHHILVVGAGQMGAGIAQVALRPDHPLRRLRPQDG